MTCGATRRVEGGWNSAPLPRTGAYGPKSTRVLRNGGTGRPSRNHGNMWIVRSRHDEPRPFPDGSIRTDRRTLPLSALSVSRAWAACATIGRSFRGLFERHRCPPATLPAVRGAHLCVASSPACEPVIELIQNPMAAPCHCGTREGVAALVVHTRAHCARSASETISQYRPALPGGPFSHPARDHATTNPPEAMR